MKIKYTISKAAKTIGKAILEVDWTLNIIDMSFAAKFQICIVTCQSGETITTENYENIPSGIRTYDFDGDLTKPLNVLLEEFESELTSLFGNKWERKVEIEEEDDDDNDE